MADLFFQFVARGQQQVVGATRDVKTALAETEQAASKVDASTRKAESTFSRMGTTMTRTVTPAAAAAGATFLAASRDFDRGTDALRAGAGATGQALDDMTASAQRLAGEVTSGFGVVATTMADLATRTGASGQALEDLTRQTVQLQELGMGGDVATLTRVFGDWGVALEDSAGAIDRLYVASQTTGPSVDRLGQLMVQFGAPLREFGFEMDEAAALLGKFEQEGVNTELVMGALRVALGKFAAAGKDPVQALEDVIGQIQTAGSAADANSLAFETFGRRAGIDMSRAIQEGRFNLEELNATLAANTDTVGAAYGETVGLVERLDMLKDRAFAAIGPISDVGFAVAGIAVAAGPTISGLERMTKGFGGIAGVSRSAASVMSGPWGLAIAGAAVGIGLLWREQQQANDRLKRADELIDGNTGALLENAAQSRATQLQQTGQADVADRFGISLSTLTSASMGAAGAQNAMRHAIDETIAAEQAQLEAMQAGTVEFDAQHALIERLTNQGDQLIGTVREEASALDEATAAREAAADAAERIETENQVRLNRTAYGFDQALGSVDAYARTYDRIGPAIGAVVSAHDSWIGTLGRVRDAEYSTRSAIDLTTDAMRRRMDTARAAVDPVFAVTSAQRRLSDAQAALVTVQGDATSTQQAIQAAEEDAATAALDLEGALVDLRGAQVDGTTSGEDFEEVLRRQVEEGRLTEEVYEALVDRLDEIESAARRAGGALAGLQGGVQLPGSVNEALSTTGGTNVLPSVRDELAGVDRTAPPDPGTVTGTGSGGVFAGADQSTSVTITGPVTIGARTVAAADPEVRELARVLVDEIDHLRARR